MKLTVQRVMDVLPLITAIINEKRPMPQKGKYRLAQLDLGDATDGAIHAHELVILGDLVKE